MALENPRYKLESSIGMVKFSNRELIHVRDFLDWSPIYSSTNATVRNSYQKNQMVEALRLSALFYHLEIMKASLIEHKTEFSNQLNSKHINHLEELIDFIRHFRNACMHTEEELVPTWSIKNPKNENVERLKKLQEFGLSVNIPCIEENGEYYFNEKSVRFKKIKFKKIEDKKQIRISNNVIKKLILLSDYILFILKKKKSSTLSKFLDCTLNIKSKNSFKRPRQLKHKVTPEKQSS